jgi:hypothetical protein
MPRRPRKLPPHLYKPGESGNPKGRTIGSTNQINNEIKQAFAILLHDQLPNLEKWLAEGAKKDPLKAADLMLRVSERFLPSLSRTELVGKDGEAFTPITIHLPNIPKVSLGVGAPSQNPMELGDSSPIAMLQPPGQPGSLGESSSGEIIQETPGPMDPPVEYPGAEEPSPMFQVPPLELSPNVLKDIQERGDTPLAQDRGMGEPTT